MSSGRISEMLASFCDLDSETRGLILGKLPAEVRAELIAALPTEEREASIRSVDDHTSVSPQQMQFTMACLGGDLPAAKRALAAGAVANIPDANGVSPIHHASHQGAAVLELCVLKDNVCNVCGQDATRKSFAQDMSTWSSGSCTSKAVTYAPQIRMATRHLLQHVFMLICRSSSERSDLAPSRLLIFENLSQRSLSSGGL